MRYRHSSSPHLPIGSGVPAAACKIVLTQRLTRAGMAWTTAGGPVMLAVRVIGLRGGWDAVHGRYVASQPMPVTPVEIVEGTHRGQQAAEVVGMERLYPGGRGTMEKERPPVFGMIERGGQVVINLLANVKQKTIEPLIKDTIDAGTLVYTDEYSIYARLQSWGYDHKSVNHGRGEFARVV